MKPFTRTIIWVSVATLAVVLVFILLRGYWFLQAMILGIASISFITIAIRRRPPGRANKTQRLLWAFLALLGVYLVLLIVAFVILAGK